MHFLLLIILIPFFSWSKMVCQPTERTILIQNQFDVDLTLEVTLKGPHNYKEKKTYLVPPGDVTNACIETPTTIESMYTKVAHQPCSEDDQEKVEIFYTLDDYYTEPMGHIIISRAKHFPPILY